MADNNTKENLQSFFFLPPLDKEIAKGQREMF